MTKEITYTQGQEAGSVLFGQFYLDPMENIMVLKGYSGTGKSTLVRRLLSEIPKLDEMCETVNPNYRPYEILLTATTNQAAEALATSIGFTKPVATIHKTLGLRVQVLDYRKQTKELRATGKGKKYHSLIFVDEASYVDKHLMNLIMQETEDCKIVFIGDPAQLKPVGSSYMPAFEMNRNEIELTEMVRFDDGPISNLVSALRRTVLEGVWPNFSDYLAKGVIEKVDREMFNKMVHRAFQEDRPVGSCKILAYTNDCVIGYNTRLTQSLLGSADPQPGQIMVNNEECSFGVERVPNNLEVLVETVTEATDYGYPGWFIKLRGYTGTVFMPKNARTVSKTAHQEAVRNDDFEMMQTVTDSWIDLRPAFACTGNKAQGSTYDTTFIDLGNIISMVRGGDALARMLYVICSRARSRMFFTGDKNG